MSEATPEPRATHPSPVAKRSVLIGSIVLFALGTIGSNIGPAVIDDHPAWVLALSSRNRNLFASVPYIDPLSYAIIGFVRLLVAGSTLFFLGRWYGERAIAWTEKQAGELPALYRWFARAMDRAGWLVVIVFCASNLVWMMAGHRRMAPARYVALLSVGIAIRLGLLWAGGRAFEDQIRSFLNWMEDYQWWVVGGLFAVSFAQSARRAKRDLPEVVHEIEHPTEQ